MLWKLPALTGLAILLVCAGLQAPPSNSNWLPEGPLASLLTDDGRMQELDAMDRIITERIQKRIKIIDKVLAGQMSLLDAAGKFRAFGVAGADNPLAKLVAVPGKTQEEKLCRQVILWAAAQSEGTSESQARAAVARLIRELEDALARGNGTIQLPVR